MTSESYALRLIKQRLRSVWEIDQALLRRGVEESERGSVIEKLVRVGLLDDLRFARAYVHTRDLLSPRGEFVLKQELKRKGVLDQIVTQILSERRIEAQDDETLSPESQAKEILRRHERQYAHLTPEARKRRASALLQRRGFSYDTVRRILDV